MPINSKVKRLYDALKADGGDVGTPEEFNSWFLKPGKEGYKNRKSVYDTFKADGADVGKNYEEFGKWLGLHAVYPTVNKYHQQMLNSVDPNKSRASEFTHRAVSQAKRGMNNVRKPVVAKVVNREGKPTGKEFAITPAKTVEDLDREYAQETTKNWENELHDQMADADKDAAKISDMFKSFIGSTDEVGSVWGNMTRGGGIAGTPHSVTTNNGILENTEARQLLAAGEYNRKRKELLQLEQDSRNGATFDNHSFFRGMYDAAKDTGILTGGASNLINAGSLIATKQDLDNGVHTKAGDMLMQQAVKNSNAQSQYGDNQGWMYTGGVITTNMAPFIVQIASAGFSKGLSTSIGKVVQGAASKVALGTMKKAAGFASADLAKNIGKVTGLTTKAFGKAIQYGIVGAAQANTVGLGNVANDVINRYTGQVYQDEQGNYKFGTFDSDGKLVHEGGEDFLTALVKGEAAQTIEFATELAGGGIDAVGTALKNFVTKGGKKIINKYNMENVSKVIDFLLNNKVAKNARYLKAGADRTLGKVEVNSIVGESLEEELGIIANTVFTGDNKISDLWDEKQQSQIWGGMLLSIGLMKGVVAPFHAYNAKQYYSYKHKLNKADVNLSQLLGKEKWEELRNQIDATTNEDMPEMVNKINRDVALGKNRQPVREYIQNLLIMRGYDIGNMLAAKKAVEDKGEGVSVKNMEKNQAYQQGRDAYGYDTHEIQLDQEDKQKSLAQLLGISEQQLASMSDEELESFSGRDDNIDRAIYEYQLSSARYEGVVDNARDQIDLEVQRAAQAVDMYTDKSRNTIRNATIKASGGLEDYGVYIISGNIATHDDGSIDVSNSDDMILYYDQTTNTVEHADAMMFAELGSEENADEVRSQAMADAKEKAIKETTGIIDGVVEVGTQFKTVDADGTEHTYEVLADNGDGTAMITIDGNVPTELVKGENVQIPYSFEDLQKMKDLEDQKRLEAAKAEREQMEKERAEQQMQSQTTQAENPAHEDNIQSAPIEDNIDYSDIIREDGKVQMVDVSDKYGNNLFPDAKDVFYIQGNKMRTKFAYIDVNGELKTQSFPTGLVKIKTRGEVSVDDYKKYRNTILAAESSFLPESSKIEDNSGENRGEIKEEAPTTEGETAEPAEETATPESAEDSATEQNPAAEQTPAITLEDGTIVPMLEDGNPDFSKLSAAQTAELYDTQFDEDADGIVSGYVSDAKKALDKANNMTVKGKTFVEQKAAKDAKEKAIADAQAAYDSAIAIRDAYNERQLAKDENTPEGRKSLIEKAKRKFARLKNSEEWSERPGDLWNETVGKLLHRLYDATGIDVFDDTPNTVYEYVAANVGPYSLNYEGNDNSKGVQQETGLSRSDFAKLGWLAAEGKGMTIDAKVHRLWENRPSNLEGADTQDIRNTLISLITSGQTAFQARDYILNQRIELAEDALEEQLRQEEDAAEAQRAKEEEEKKKAEEEKTNENRNAPELSNEQQKAKEKGEKLGFPAVDKEGEPINQNVIELANWAKEQGLEIDPTSKLNSYADLYVMCKDGFGVSTLVPDVGEDINQVFYFPDNVQGEQLLKLQEEFNVGRDLKHSADMNSELTEGAMFYDGDTAREFRDFVNEKVKEESKTIEVPEDATDEKPLGEQLSEDKVPFKIEGEKSGVTYDINDNEDRKRLVAENSVDDKDVLDIDMPKHVHKSIKELCKKMGLKVQFLYMGARLNGWIENGTMYLALDANKATQFVFGHEMTHAIKQKNPEAYKELVKVAMAVTTKKKFEEDLAKVYRIYHNASGYNNIDDFVEEVIADNIGKFINDYDLAQRFVLRLNHPVLATILLAIQKIKSLLYGDFYKSVDALERIVEKAYVDTAKGETTNSETGEDVSFSLRGSTPYDKQMEEWKEKNHLEKDATPMKKPVMKEGENIFDYANRMVEWTRNQNLWKTAPKQTGFQEALDKWKADNGIAPGAYPPVHPIYEDFQDSDDYNQAVAEYRKEKEVWKTAPKPKDFDLSVDLDDMNKQLRNIRRAVLNQKNYDQRTVKAVSDLVRKMLNIGWGDGLSRGKVGNLLSAAKNATGANDVKKYLDKAMGILAENYLNRLSTAYDNLINTKGARADQSGVIKMGSLDAKGQAFMSEYKKAINMDDSSLNTYIANIEDDSAKNEDNVEMNDYRLAGIQAAIMYKQQIGGNDADISELKRQIGELKNKKDATKEDKDLLKSLEKKLFENKFDRITMFENLLNNIQRMVKESKGRAKEFREEIAEHKNEILHRANLDLEGMDSAYYDTTTAKKKFVNNVFQRAAFSSTYTFEQFLKFFGKHSANGEGYLYNYFTKLNQDALDEEQLYNEMNRNSLDEKTKELFGKEKFMKLVGIDGKGMKEMDIDVTDYSNKETGKRTIHLKQGQMLYIYLVNKETDGEMKLRAMGITEEKVDEIEKNLDPRVKAMGEWLQDEYLPECQRRYQSTHTKYFGAPMKEIENYFPLAINNRARNVREDVNQDSDAMSRLAGTSTGAIITRRVNVIPLDIENVDAFEVAFNHLQEMEEWSAMQPFRQDINTLLSYTHFRNQVQNMSSVAYGSGKTLWDEFMQTAQIAAGTYKPKVKAGMMDSRIAAAMGGVAVAKISGRLWTAIKQSQSATVFLPECDFTRFVMNGVNPYGSWKWAMENIPDFRKRVENMTYGDVKLRQYLDELEKWHDWTKTISKIGMAPNILVDGITCAVGARSVYETEVNRLTKLGYPKDKADEKAYYKAVAAYNKTQQSSGGMYLSPMQVDRTYVSAALSLFKNANYAYGRMQIEACRGLARTYDFWGGKHKTTLIESMTRQIMGEDGLNENTARTIAKATYNRTFRQSVGRLINFATLVPVSWALYKVLPYLLTGDDDDKKKDMIEEAVLKGFATSLSDNYVIPFASNILNAGLKVENGKPTFDPEVFRYQNLYINPATSDLANIYSMIGNQKWYSVANKLGMLGVQSLIGFNPETVGALYQAFAEADYDNGNTAKEWQIGILKAISAPEESIRELYMDELGLKSGDIKKIPLVELEKRYAERQINRDNLLSQIGMDAETFNGYVNKYQKSFEKKIKDKMNKWDEYDKKKANEFFDTTSDPKLKDMIEKKRVKDANAAADDQITKEGLNQEKKGKEPSEVAYDAVKMSIDVAEDNAISTYNKVLNKRYAALNDEYNEQTDAMKYIFMSKHPNFKAYKDLESKYITYGKKMKELKEKLVSADGYDAKQTILKQIRAEREKFSELQSKVR